MGKKKRGPSLEELLARPWCYYCERDFDDLKILISHQKAKHFKCERCGRRLNTAGGLSVHMSQVHKEQLSAVDNALPNRSSLDVEIFGMEGVPEDVVQAHNQRVVTQFQQAEAERQAVTGNPPPGSTSSGQPAKKPKLGDISNLKKRLADHKAKRAELLAGGSSGEVTPVGAGQSVQVPGGFAQSPPPANANMLTGATPNQQYPYPAPYPGAASPPQSTTSLAYQNFPQGGQPTYPPTTQFAPSGYTPPPFQAGPHGAPSQAYGTPASPYTSQLQQAPRTHTPPQQPVSTFAPRPPALPTAPSLPQRPAFGGPHVNAHQMQQMHMGHPVPPMGLVPSAQASAPAVYSNGDKAPGAGVAPASISASVDDLISDAAKQADEAASKPAETTEEKPSKKEKTKPTRLVYSDNETSPEEKLARLPRYAFVPNRKGEMVLGELPGSVVVGTIRESDTITDPAK